MATARICAALLVATLSATAHAQAPSPADTAAQSPAPAALNERRSGFTFGATLGFAFGRAIGYPNEVHKIGDAAFRANTHLSLGSGGELMFGGALRDWFTFSVGGSSTRLVSSSSDLQDWSVLLRVEAFPAYGAGGPWRDLSVYGDFGVGSARIFGDSSRSGDGGNMSHVGFGVAHETWRSGHFTLGPALGYYTMFSQSLHSHVGLVALRASFYGGP
jgi:hypothetical protein